MKKKVHNQTATCEECGKQLKISEGYICDSCLRKYEKEEENGN